jgi:hypothetical protein
LTICCRTSAALRRSETTADEPSNAITGTNSAARTRRTRTTGDSTTVRLRRPTTTDMIRNAPNRARQCASARL